MPPRQRVSVGTQISSGGFRPAAGPVDAFVRPSEGAELGQLADALGQLSPSLRRLAQSTQALDIVENQKAADEAFLEEQEQMRAANLTFEEAVKTGVIKNHQNPFRRARQAELHGRAAAEREATAWMVYRNENLPEGSTLEDYDDAFNAFHEQYINDNVGASAMDEPAFATAYRQTNQVRLINDRRAFASSAAVGYDFAANEAFFGEVLQGALNDIQSGVAVEESAQNLQARLDEHLQMTGATGARRSQVNELARRAFLDATIRAAASSDIPGSSEEYLKALERVTTAPGQNLGSDPRASSAIEQARDQIQQNNRAREVTVAQTIQARETELKSEMALLALGTDQEDVEALRAMEVELMNLGGPNVASNQTFIDSLRRTQDVSRGLNTRSEDGLVDDLITQIWSDPGNPSHPSIITQAFQDGRLSRNDAITLRNTIASSGGTRSSGGALNDPIFKALESAMDGTMRRPGFMGTITADMADRFVNYQGYRNRAWNAWYSANPDASPIEKETQLQAIHESAVRIYRDESMNFSMAPTSPPDFTDPVLSWQYQQVISPTDLTILEQLSSGGIESLTEPQFQRFTVLGNTLGIDLNDTDHIAAIIAAQSAFITPETDDGR